MFILVRTIISLNILPSFFNTLYFGLPLAAEVHNIFLPIFAKGTDFCYENKLRYFYKKENIYFGKET